MDVTRSLLSLRGFGCRIAPNIMSLQIISLLMLSVLSSSPGTGKEPQTAQRIGDVVLTLVDLEERKNEQTGSSHHTVVVRFRAENVGKLALCTGFSPTLKATFALQYHEGAWSSHRLEIRELLPGEKTEGEYEFLVKNGAEPLQITLKPTSESQTCERGKDSFSSIWHSSDEVKFNLTGSSAALSLQEAPPPQAASSRKENTGPEAQLSETSLIRIFLRDTKGAKDQANATKVFQDRCPQVQITTERERANYFVELRPASWTQSKNVVVVANKAGDVIHSGATYNLGNAAKEACAAILNSFKAGPKQ